MNNLKISLRNLDGIAVLSRTEMKNVIGGVQQVYHCTCTNGTTGAWNMPGSDTPTQGQINQSIDTNCSNAQHGPGTATCGWQTCGNPGVPCTVITPE